VLMSGGVYTAACFQIILQLMGTRWLEAATLHASHAPRSKARMMKRVPARWLAHACGLSPRRKSSRAIGSGRMDGNDT
jgi:hypothetical protein